MSRTNDKDKDLTLRQAYERFVPLHVRQEYEFSVDTKNKYEARHDIRPSRRNTRIFHRFGDGAPVRRRNPAEISGEYKKLKSDVAAADRAAIGCFFRQLALCTVEARKGSPTEPLTVIPVSALPSLDDRSRHRLRITSYDASTTAFGHKDKQIDYYDVRVSLPDDYEGPDDRRSTRATPQVSAVALARFLEDRVSELGRGDPRLTEKSLIDAAIRNFPEHLDARMQVRNWIENDMEPSKRFRRGQKPRKAIVRK